MTTLSPTTSSTPVRRARGRFAALAAAALALTGLTTGVTATPASAALLGCTYLDQYFGNQYYVQLPSHFTGATSPECYLYQKPGVQYGVKQLQQALNICYGHRLGVDGIFGAGTKFVLAQVQAQEGVKADGVWGSTTKWAMKWPVYGRTSGAYQGWCWERF